MSKGRNKKNKQTQQNKPEPKVNVSLPTNISAEEMQHIIARAMVEADEIKEQNKQAKKEVALKQWRSDIGYKEYDDKCKLLRGTKTFLNRLKCFAKVCFIPKKKIQGDRASFSLMQMFLQAFFVLTKWLLVLAAIVSVIAGIVGLCTSPILSAAWAMGIYLVFVAIPLFLISRMFRMASIEVEKIEDRNYLFGLFASVASIVSIIIAIIAVVKGD